MRFLSTLFALLLTASVHAQCHRCGMFGMLQDNFEEVYVARFTAELDSIQLESARTCEVITAPCELQEVSRGSRFTKIYLRIDHPRFDGADYRIKYPTGDWGIVSDSPGYW